MSGRCRWPLLLAVVGLLPSVGCVNLMSLGRDNGTRATDGDSVNARSPDLPLAKKVATCLEVAAAEEREGKLDEAIMEYERARYYNPNVKNVARRLAVLYDRKGYFKKALEEHRKALQEAPRDANLVNNLGYHYYLRGQWAEAEKQYRKAVELNAQHKCAWVNLGMALGQQNRYDESLAAFQKSISPAEAHSNLGFILTTQGKRVEAKLEYQKALDLEPDMTKARECLQKLEQAEAKARTAANNRAANLLLKPAPDAPLPPQQPLQAPPVPEPLPVPEKINVLPTAEAATPLPPAPRNALRTLEPSPMSWNTTKADVPGPTIRHTAAEKMPQEALPTPPAPPVAGMSPPGPFDLPPVHVPEADNVTVPPTK